MYINIIVSFASTLVIVKSSVIFAHIKKLFCFKIKVKSINENINIYPLTNSEMNEVFILE
jgi:hypothetical protein